MYRAMTSFPVPVSPVTITVVHFLDTLFAISTIEKDFGSWAIMESSWSIWYCICLTITLLFSTSCFRWSSSVTSLTFVTTISISPSLFHMGLAVTSILFLLFIHWSKVTVFLVFKTINVADFDMIPSFSRSFIIRPMSFSLFIPVCFSYDLLTLSVFPSPSVI